MHARLTFDLRGRIGDVSLPSVYTIGRAPSCDLVLEHMFVSNLHCTFMLEQHGVAVFDHESANGTLVNGVRIRGKSALRDGDVVEVGPHAFTLSLTEETVTSAASTAVRPAMMLNLGVQRSTFTDQAAVSVRPAIEIVESAQRTRCFRDVVKAKDASIVAIAGDLAADATGTAFADLRRTVRNWVSGGITAIRFALDETLLRLGSPASLLVLRLDPATGLLSWSNSRTAPVLVRRGTAQILEGEEASMMIGDVLVVPSMAIANVLATQNDPALGVKDARAQIVSIWLGAQLAKTGQAGCAVCVEILGA